MDPSSRNDFAIIYKIEKLASNPSEYNIGDALGEALALLSVIKDETGRQLAGIFLSRLRTFARRAEVGWQAFSSVPKPSHRLSDGETIQLFLIEETLHEFCYGAERVNEVSSAAGETSTPIRFYVNSLYHYVSTLYLLDKKNSAMGGTIFKVFDSLGLSYLLVPIQAVLDKPLGKGISFGETVRQFRNDYVHGRFSPIDIESIVRQSEIRDQRQRIRLVDLMWELFYQSLLLRLELIAILTASGIDLEKLMAKFLAESSTAEN